MGKMQRVFSWGLILVFVFGLVFIPGGKARSVPLWISIPTESAYIQNFDGIGTSATATVPGGWAVAKDATNIRSVGAYTSATTATERVGGNNMGTSASNGIYNYGVGDAATATDRSIGFLSSGSATKSGNLYAYLHNNSGSALTSLTISYNVEKYRNGSNAAGFSIQMYYSSNGTDWTSAGSNFLTSFGANSDNTGFSSAPGSTTAVSAQTLSVAIPDGSDLYLAWNYSVTSGTTTTNAQGLGIDDVSILGVGATGPTNPSGTGAAATNPVLAGDPSLLTVNVTPGSNPTSSGLSVTCDLSGIGGSASQTFSDDGSTGGDVTDGDNIFSYNATIDSATTAGTKSLPCSIGDEQSRSGSATIGFNVYAILPIGSVNGVIGDTTDAPSHNAAYNGQAVTIQGVIYEKTLQAISNSVNTYKGFFIQNTSATADTDPKTSDGIFVFMSTSSTMTGPSGPYTPAVGDEVILHGTVSEYYNMTELTGSTLFKPVVRSGVDIENEIPPVVAAPPANLNDANRYWERLQGIRVEVPTDSIVMGGRNVFSPADAEIWLAAPDSTVATRTDPYTRRSFRDANPLDDNYDPTTWDGNGYRILMGSLGIKGSAGDAQTLIDPARTFDTVTNAPAGGINYSFSKYRIEVSAQPTFSEGVDPAANNPPTAVSDRTTAYSIVDYNLENLYDYRDNPFSGCDFTGNTGCAARSFDLGGVTPPYDYVPASDIAYQARLNDISLQIINDLHNPDILMVQEVENQDICSVSDSVLVCGTSDNADGKPDVLQELALKIAANGGSAYDAAWNRNSSDLRGIAPAYLYRTDRVTLVPATSSDPVLGNNPVIDYPGVAVAYNSDVSNPKTLNAVSAVDMTGCETTRVFPRAPDIALFRIYTTSVGVGNYRDVYVINNHFKSSPDVCVAARTEQAKYNAAIVKAIEAANPLARIVLGGDLNVYPHPDNTSYGATDQLAALYAPSLGLKNLWEVLLENAPESAYSYVYLGMAQTLDQMYVNGPMLTDLQQYRIAHINSDFAADYPGDVARGTSDHDPQAAIFGINNLPPRFSSTAVTNGTVSLPYTYNISATDPDVMDNLTITATVLPSWLILTDNHDRTASLTGTPATGNTGANHVTLHVEDGNLSSDQSFTIDVSPFFGKYYAANGATNRSTALTLSWLTSSGATSYEYCITKLSTGSCDTGWVSTGTNRTAVLTGLSGNTTYYWQVKALKGASTVFANGGAWWSFTTGNCYTLTTNANPVGDGLTGVDVSPNCEGGKYASATIVHISQTPNKGYSFSNWSGNANGNTEPLTITMSMNKTITANYSPLCYSLSVSISPAGSGKTTASPAPNCAGGKYTYGTTIHLTGTPYAGYSFSNWTGDAADSANPTMFNIFGDMNETANFAGLPPAAFGKYYAANGATGRSTALTLSWLTSNRATSYEYCITTLNTGVCDTGWVSTGASRVAVLTGLAGNTPYYWQVRGVNGTSSVEADAGNWWSFTTGNCYTMTTGTVPTGSGSVGIDLAPNCAGGKYATGSILHLMATANGSYTFSNWSGNANGSLNPLTVTMSQNKTITANFH